MKKQTLILIIGLLVSSGMYAQIGKTIRSYEGEEGVTITHLDKSVYGLYKKKNIPPEAEKVLKQIQEVNLLSSVNENVNQEAGPKIRQELQTNYQLIKSRNNKSVYDKIYVKTNKELVTDLVVWKQAGSQQLNIIELRGNMDLENIASLSKALNIKGLHSLSELSPQNEEKANYRQYYDYEQLSGLSRKMQEMAEKMRQEFSSISGFSFDMSPMDSVFNSMEFGFGTMGDIFEQLKDQNFEPFTNGEFISNSVQITDENGKTKIKINTRNSDMIYIVDGVEFDGDEVTLPESIRSADIVRDPSNAQKSYLIVLSQNPLGKFISLKNNILKFNYNDQEYQFNLEKSGKPQIWLNGKPAYDFKLNSSDEIRQIRPVSEAEKKTGAFQSAEVIINTKNKSFSEIIP